MGQISILLSDLPENAIFSIARYISEIKKVEEKFSVSIDELDIPLQLITFVILDNEPYDKCKAIIDLLEDNIDGDIVTWNVMPLSTRKTFSALDEDNINATVH